MSIAESLKIRRDVWLHKVHRRVFRACFVHVSCSLNHEVPNQALRSHSFASKLSLDRMLIHLEGPHSPHWFIPKSSDSLTSTFFFRGLSKRPSCCACWSQFVRMTKSLNSVTSNMTSRRDGIDSSGSDIFGFPQRFTQ